jgi:hypothetical protein
VLAAHPDLDVLPSMAVEHSSLEKLGEKRGFRGTLSEAEGKRIIPGA